ncbi:MAG: hypothetical protein QM610_12360 [Chitinophagaceae bacterium]
MKRKQLRLVGLGYVAMLGAILASCNKSNSSAPLPSMMDFMLSTNWRLDSIVVVEGSVSDTLTMADVPGFSTSSIRFYNREDSSFVFRDVLDATLTGPDGKDTLFQYAYGRWALSDLQDSIYLYSQDSVKAKDYTRAWAVSKNDSTSTLYADYADTVYRGVDVGSVILQKRVVFVKSTFY